MDTHPWIIGSPDISGEALRAVTRSLADAGVRTAAADGRVSGPGVAVVSNSDAPARAFLSTLAHSGRRVLAIIHPRAGHAADPWPLLETGASDVLTWEDPDAAVQAASARLTRWAHVESLLNSSLIRDNLVGDSLAWRAFLRSLIEIALFSEAHVLISGETGTGKELAARLIHTLRSTAKKDLVVVDCTTIVPELAGSELFGHERGAYTGADRSRDGAFALADGGTLFLDEVGELPLPLQSQLLRVVQEGTYKRVGGNTWEHTSFRLVCATNRDLRAEVAAGRFRRDLYYRIAGEVCTTPALRQRRDDIVPLALRFLQEATGAQPLLLSAAVREYLLGRDYAGNVRDLKRLAHAIGRRHQGPGPVTIGAIPKEEWGERRALASDSPPLDGVVRRALAEGMGLKDIGRLVEEVAINVATTDTSTLREAASRLGVTERAIQLRRASGRDRASSNGTHHDVVTLVSSGCAAKTKGAHRRTEAGA
ncbi:MAG: sigma-54-dependent Fis family transcriptional regulator [Pyrinomonadaceae bacterium]|nr:sigma-54-dependent Fis family transcriptional regulator [Phycisphaerales bacterium]